MDLSLSLCVSLCFWVEEFNIAVHLVLGSYYVSTQRPAKCCSLMAMIFAIQTATRNTKVAYRFHCNTKVLTSDKLLHNGHAENRRRQRRRRRCRTKKNEEHNDGKSFRNQEGVEKLSFAFFSAAAAPPKYIISTKICLRCCRWLYNWVHCARVHSISAKL